MWGDKQERKAGLERWGDGGMGDGKVEVERWRDEDGGREEKQRSRCCLHRYRADGKLVLSSQEQACLSP